MYSLDTKSHFGEEHLTNIFKANVNSEIPFWEEFINQSLNHYNLKQLFLIDFK